MDRVVAENVIADSIGAGLQMTTLRRTLDRWLGATVLLAWLVPATAMADAPLQRPKGLIGSPMWSGEASATSSPPVGPVEPPATVEPTPVAVTPAPPEDATPTSQLTAPQPITDVDDPVAEPIAPPAAAAAAGPTGLRKQHARDLGKFSHRGFTFDFRVGTVGCVKAMCASDRHDVHPGIRLDGFLGGNIKGWVDVGISGGWGALSSNAAKGTNVLTLYGLDPYLMQQALGVIGGKALGIDLTALNVQSSKLRTAQVGPLVRVHFIPRGRYAAWVGSGVQYNLLRARYDTPVGQARIDFHGLAVPIEAGFAVHVLRNLAIGAQFDYMFTFYPLTNISQGGSSFTLPTRILDQAARMQNSAFKSQLPQFWTVALTLRARV
jgi:hypothetical protein